MVSKRVRAASSSKVHILGKNRWHVPPLDVAIVGMSCFLPGASNLRQFWDNIVHGRDLVGEVPQTRFNADLWFSPDRREPDKTYSRWGGFLPEIEFDPLRYGIPPKALPSIEPMQLLTLKLVDEALHDAGYPADNPYGPQTSVVFGVGGGLGDLGCNYVTRSLLPGLAEMNGELDDRLPEWTEDSFPGLLLNVVSGRVANRFDFNGVNFAVDAACGSSLAAVYVACSELANRTSRMVIAGGVDTVQNPFSYTCFSKSQALSPRGKCRPFDESADGIAISEGLACLVLKRVEDAVADGDRIYAVIRGIAGGSDGKSRSLTAPRREGQELTLRRAYQQAGFDPSTISLVECHGTGTKLGDRVECESLASVLRESGAAPRSVGVSSVKSMIGHTKAAAGAAGLIKAALSLHFRVLPPTLHVEQPLKDIFTVESPVYVSSELRPWVAGEHPRRAGVSAFGFGGTNFHAVLEEYDARLTSDDQRESAITPGFELFLLRAPSENALIQSVHSLRQLASGVTANESIGDLAFAWYVSQQAASGDKRAAVVCSSHDELIDRLASLETYLEQQASGKSVPLPAGCFHAAEPLAADGRVAILFPGQGSQFPNMFRDLAIEFPEVTAEFDCADQVLGDRLPNRLSSRIFPPPSFTDEERKAVVARLNDTRFAQPALGCCSVAMLHLLERFGVRGTWLAGHSYGELAAFYAAGAMDESTLYCMSALRGKAMHAAASDPACDGTMVAVSANEREIVPVIVDLPGVWIANLNSPQQTILSGTRAGIEAACRSLEARQIAVKPLSVSGAFHTELLKSACDELQTSFGQFTFSVMTTPVFSNVTAQPLPTEVHIAEHFAEHLVSRVRFVEQIRSMWDAGARLFVECGPGSVLTGLVSRILHDRPHAAIASAPKAPGGRAALLNALANCFVQGVDVNPLRLFEGRREQPDRPTAKVSEHAWIVDGGLARPANAARPEKRPPVKLRPSNFGPVDSSERPTVILAPARQQTAQPADERTSSPLVQVAAAHAKNGKVSPENQPEHVEVPGVQAPSRVGSSQATSRSSMLAPPAANPEAVPPHHGGHSLRSIGTDDVNQAREIQPPHSTQPRQGTMNSATDDPMNPVTPTSNPFHTRDANSPPHRMVAANVGIDGQWLVEFQQTMRAFLQTQERVTLAYLNSLRGGPPLAARPNIAALPASSNQGVIQQTTVQPPSPSIAHAVHQTEPNAMPSSSQRVHHADAAPLVRSPSTGTVPAHPPTVEPVKVAARQIDSRAASTPATQQPALQPIRATSSTPAAVSLDGLSATLLDLVSQRTGYPASMLSMDADIEGELGIDSIKRTEILGLFSNHLNGVDDEIRATYLHQISSAKTFGAILDAAMKLLADSASGQESVSVPAEATPSAGSVTNAAVTDGLTSRGDVSSTTASFSARELGKLLIDITSQRTGYPASVLSLDVDIEGELGIDSIKRIEILSEFRLAVFSAGTEPPAAYMERVGKAKMLGEIVQAMVDVLGEAQAVAGSGAEAAPVVVEPATSDRTESMDSTSSTDSTSGSIVGCHRSVMVVVPEPLEMAIRCRLRDGILLVVDDAESDLGLRLVQRVTATGRIARLLRSDAFTTLDAAQQVIDPVRSDGSIAGLIYLPALREGKPFGTLGIDEAWQCVQHEVKSVLFLLQALTPELSADGEQDFAFLAATLAGGDFDGNDESEAAYPWRGGLAGLLRCAQSEWKNARFRCVDFDEQPSLETLIDELHAIGPVEVGYRNSSRLKLVSRREELPELDDDAALELDGNDVVLLTGGARGITALLAMELAKRTPARLVLVGRTRLVDAAEFAAIANLDEAGVRQMLIEANSREGRAVSPARIQNEVRRKIAEQEVYQNLQAMRQVGATVEYIECDACDPRAFGQCLTDLEQRIGDITAIVHGAGIIEDKLLRDKSAESFDRVLRTKLMPLLVMNEQISLKNLKFLMVFSSVASQIGNPGQGDYAAANETLNRIARWVSNQGPARAVAMNWGPWDGSGMVQPDVARQFASRGIHLVPVDAGLSAAWNELVPGRSERVRVLIGTGPWSTGPQISAPQTARPVFEAVEVVGR